MKKVLFFLLVFWPIKVYASDLILNNLVVKNGDISPSFDPLNNQYTVTLDNDIYNLELEYKLDSAININILDNNVLKNNSKVSLVLDESGKTVTYELHILKDEGEELPVFLETNNTYDTSFMALYKIYIIPITCLILIFIIFKILFHKKHKKNTLQKR